MLKAAYTIAALLGGLLVGAFNFRRGGHVSFLFSAAITWLLFLVLWFLVVGGARLMTYLSTHRDEDQ
jgi:hypothetical protein